MSLSRADTARLRLLEAGLQCFAERGLEGTSIRELAKEAGQNSAAIKYYFESKEGLYHAVIEAVMRFMQTLMSAVSQEYGEALSARKLSSDQAAVLLRKMRRNMLQTMLTNPMASRFALLLVREQTRPSAAFEPLFKQAIEPLHRMFAHLVSVVSGDPIECERSILRAHSLIGQVQIFIMARETILRRLGWETFDESHAEHVLDMMQADLERLMESWKSPSAFTGEAEVRQRTAVRRKGGKSRS
ncbi:MAG TPA: CerR family C-terminal domain-containing protein [Planctomicrobium sp.]|nr:CerR family C-terminal domain-containing protein [Planctomicrobium sp.]